MKKFVDEVKGKPQKFFLTCFYVLPIINEYIAKTMKGNSRSVSFSESCRAVRGSSVNFELALESFCRPYENRKWRYFLCRIEESL